MDQRDPVLGLVRQLRKRNRIVHGYFDVDVSGITHSGSVPVGMEPVAVAARVVPTPFYKRAR